MLGGHGQNYFNEAVALAIACIPVVLLACLLIVSLFEHTLRKARTLPFKFARGVFRQGVLNTGSLQTDPTPGVILKKL